MDYIMKTQEGILVYTSGQCQPYKKGIKQFLNELLIEEYATYDSRMETIKKRHNMHRNIPIYINDKYCFYTIHSLRHEAAICINYHRVLSIRNTSQNTTEVIFKNLKILKIAVPYAYVIRKHMRTGWFIHNQLKEH